MGSFMKRKALLKPKFHESSDVAGIFLGNVFGTKEYTLTRRGFRASASQS